jgi:two-component system NtrC family sensor kinase
MKSEYYEITKNTDLWLIRLRGLGLAFFLIFVTLGFIIKLPFANYLAGLLALALLSNIAFLILYGKYAQRWSSIAQLVIDIFLVSGIVHLTGGASSPFSWLYVVPIIASGLLPGYIPGYSMTVLAATLSSIFYILISCLEQQGYLHHYHFFHQALAQSQGSLDHIPLLTFLSYTALFLLTAVFTHLLSLRIRSLDRDFRELFEKASESIFCLDFEGNIFLANEAALRFTGYQKSDLPIKLETLLSPQSLIKARRKLEQKLRGKSVEEPYEVEVRKKDGSKAYLELSTHIIYRNGQPVGIQGIGRDVTEKREMQQQILRRNRELLAMHRVTSLTNYYPGQLDLAFQNILRDLVTTLQISLGAIFLKEKGKSHLTEISILNPKRKKTEIKIAKKLVKEIMLQGRSLLFKNITLEHKNQNIIGQGVKSIAGVPIKTKDKTIGAIIAVDSKADRLGYEDLRLLELIAHEIGIAIENLWLYSSLQQKITELKDGNKRLATLNKVTHQLLGSLDLNAILETIVKSATEVLNTAGALLMVVEKDRLLVKKACGLRKEIVEKVGNLKIGESLSGWIAKHKKPLNLKDMLDFPGFKFAEIAKAGNHHGFLGVPLITDNKAIGVLEVFKKEREKFSTNDVALLTAFADAASLAIKKATLFAEVVKGKKEWEATFDAISDCLFIYDKNYTILRANKATAELLGTTPDKLIGRKCYTILHNFTQPCSGCPTTKTLKTKSIAFAEMDFGPGAGVYHIWTYPILDEKGAIQAIVEYKKDVTEQKLMEEQLVQSTKLAAVGELATNIAHEINNPLTSVLGYTSFLQKRMGQNSQLRHDLQIIENEAKRARAIVRNLLDFARQAPLRTELVDINQVVTDTVDLVKPLAQNASIKIEINLHKSLPAIWIDVNQIKQVFLNLINNAITAMPKGGTLKIVTERSRSFAVIKFIDTGIGIPAKHLTKVFDPFFTTKSEGKGTGLGLSISYRIVQEHGGTITVRSKEGQGSEFAVRLPLVQVPEKNSHKKKRATL